jgi:hypothetical protein
MFLVTTRNVLGMCYILYMCVCVGASDSTTTSNDPSSSSLCVVCVGHFLGGFEGGPGMPPPGYAQCSALSSSPGQRPKNFLGGGFFYF